MDANELSILTQTALLLLSVFAKGVTWLLAIAGVFFLSEWLSAILRGTFLTFSIRLLGWIGIIFVVESVVRTKKTGKHTKRTTVFYLVLRSGQVDRLEPIASAITSLKLL